MTRVTRKEFLTQTCKGGCGLVLGLGLLGSLGSCSSFKVIKTSAVNGRITIPLTDFADAPIKLVRAPQLDYDIMVHKKSETEYSALVMKCTHQDWNLIANPKGFNCSLHGSAFDLEGNVTNGPATDPLKKLTTKIDNQTLIIS